MQFKHLLQHPSLVRGVQYTLGGLFIISALLKINDPLGLQYKIDEYADAFDLLFLKEISLMSAVMMNVLEFVLGMAILLRFHIRFFRWVCFALLLFFTFLTALAFFSGKLKECGCLGNCIPLTAGMSFCKDLLLLAMGGILLVQHAQMRPCLSPPLAKWMMLVSLIFPYVAQMFIYVSLPPWDCMPFQVGKNIPEEMQRYASAVGKVDMLFTYQKDGKKVSFSADHFPVDFDSTYVFISREDKPLTSPNQDHGIADFVLTSLASQEDVAPMILAQDTAYLIGVLDDYAWEKLDLQAERIKKTLPSTHAYYIVASDSKRLDDYFSTHELPKAQALLVDNVLLKTMCRSPITRIVLVQGKIIEKQGILFHSFYLSPLQ